MVEIVWLNSAKEDLKDIYEYIASDSIKYAKHQIYQIRDRTIILKTNPYSAKLSKNMTLETIREIVFNQYRVIYRIKISNLIHIILIHHGARRFPRVPK